MIRQANKYDKTQVIQMMKEFYQQTNFDTEINLDNYEYQEQLFDAVIAGRGVIFIAENIGLLVAIINPSIFDPKTLVMNCLAWAVKPEHRNKSIGQNLINSYIDYAEKLKQQGRIKYYTIGKTPKTPDIDYSKLGFRKTDETWAR